MSAGTKTGKIGLDLTQGSIYKGLVVFASPIILAGLIQQLYSVVDLIVIGKFMGNEGTVGVSTGGEICDMVTPIATAFATAGQIYIAQLIGARERERVHNAMGTLLSLMAVMSAVFMVLTLIFHAQILHMLNCPESALRQAVNYMLITAIGIPFIFGYNAVCGILRGMGESKAPMRFIIIAAVINIVLDLAFVILFHMEAAGTALATMLSQLGSFAAAFVFMYKHKEEFDFEMSPAFFKMHKKDVKILCGLGIPQAIRSTLVRISMFWVNSSINSYGIIASSTNSIGNKIQKFLDVFSSSVAQAAAAMIGQNLGARKTDRAGKVVMATLGCTLCIASVITCIILIGPKFIFGIFTNDASVLDMGVLYLRIFIAHFFWSAVVSAFQAMVIGSGYASMNFAIGILDGIVCKIGLSILFAYVMKLGVVGFFWGTAWSRAIPALICIAYYASGKWKTRKLLTDH